MGMCWGSTVELCGLNLGSDNLGMLTIYPYRALCVQSNSAQKGINLNQGSDTWGQWGLILTKLANGCDLNIGVFRSAWISGDLGVYVLVNLLDGVCFCGCLWFMKVYLNMFYV